MEVSLYGYDELRQNRVFGINGVVPFGLTEAYIQANEQFTQYINKITYTPLPSYTSSNLYLFNPAHKLQHTNYAIVENDPECNRLGYSKLGSFIMNQYVIYQVTGTISSNMRFNVTRLL